MAYEKFRAPPSSIEYQELFDAARKNDVESLEKILTNSFDINALEPDLLEGCAAIHIAVLNQKFPVVQCLLRHSARVDLTNSDGETPLQIAVCKGDLAIIKILLDAGADPNLATGRSKRTALHSVLKYKTSVSPQQIEIIKMLLHHGADLNAGFGSWDGSLVSAS